MKRVESVKHSLSNLCLASFPLWNVLNRYDVVSEDAAFPVELIYSQDHWGISSKWMACAL